MVNFVDILVLFEFEDKFWYVLRIFDKIKCNILIPDKKNASGEAIKLCYHADNVWEKCVWNKNIGFLTMLFFVLILCLQNWQGKFR